MSRHHAIAGAKGGSVQTRAKSRALAALHRKRRGLRIHVSPSRDRESTLTELASVVRHPIRGRSIRAVAEHLRVSDRTIRRWLQGIDWPPVMALRAIRAWCAANNPGH